MNLVIEHVVKFMIYDIGWDKMEFWLVFVPLRRICPQVNLTIFLTSKSALAQLVER